MHLYFLNSNLIRLLQYWSVNKLRPSISAHTLLGPVIDHRLNLWMLKITLARDLTKQIIKIKI